MTLLARSAMQAPYPEALTLRNDTRFCFPEDSRLRYNGTAVREPPGNIDLWLSGHEDWIAGNNRLDSVQRDRQVQRAVQEQSWGDGERIAL